MKIKPDLPKQDKMKSYRKKSYIQLKNQESVKSFSFTKPKDLFGQKIFLDVDASPKDGYSRNLTPVNRKVLSKELSKTFGIKSTEKETGIGNIGEFFFSNIDN